MNRKQTRSVGWAVALLYKLYNGHGGRPGRAGILLGALLVLSGCADTFTRTQQREASCVRSRLNAAEISYEDAKIQFAEHFKSRSDISLRFAYMASLDSSRLALSIRRCFDFDRTDTRQARSLLRSNRMLRGLVKINMRDSDPQLAIGIFGDQYREIFKNDIE